VGQENRLERVAPSILNIVHDLAKDEIRFLLTPERLRIVDGAVFGGVGVDPDEDAGRFAASITSEIESPGISGLRSLAPGNHSLLA
jgi:hypothetical protein